VIVFPESEPESMIAGRRPEVWEALFRTGVPRDLFSGRYASVRKPGVLDVPEYGRLIQFGQIMHDDPVCVDPTTGQVVEIPRHGVLFVNSSIAAFTEAVRAVLERLPTTTRTRSSTGSTLWRAISPILSAESIQRR